MTSDEKESLKDITGQFGLYTISSIIATILNIGLQLFLEYFLGFDGNPLYEHFLRVGIALGLGYTLKYFMDCFITFKKQRKDDSNLIVQYLIYMVLAVIYAIFNFLIQNFFVYILFIPIGVLFAPFGTIPFLSLTFSALAQSIIPIGLAIIIVWVVKFPVDKYFIFKYF